MDPKGIELQSYGIRNRDKLCTGQQESQRVPNTDQERYRKMVLEAQRKNDSQLKEWDKLQVMVQLPTSDELSRRQNEQMHTGFQGAMPPLETGFGSRRQNEHLQGKGDAYEETAFGLQQINEQLRRQICELHSQYTSLEQQLTQSQSWSAILQKKNQELQQLYNGFTVALPRWQNECAAMKRQNKELQNELERYRAQMPQVQDSLHRQKRQHDEAEEKLQSQTASYEKQLIQLQQRIGELEKKNATLQKERDSKDQVISNLRTEVENLKKKAKPDPAIGKKQKNAKPTRSNTVYPAPEIHDKKSRDPTALQTYRARIQELETEIHRLKQDVREKNEQIRQFQEALTNHSQRRRVEHSHGQELHDQKLALGQMYLTVEGEGTKQHRRVKAKLHALRGCIDDLMDDVDSETNPLHGVAVKCSRNYNDWNLGYRILLCTLLEVCYDVCKWTLVHHMTRQAVECWQRDMSAFCDEVSVMLQDSLADECHDLETIAPGLVSQVFNPTVPIPAKELKQYTAVYRLVAEYMKLFPQDYPRMILKEMKAMEAFKHVTVDPDVDVFLKKIVPICWELVTVYKPPIFVCNPNPRSHMKVNGALHEIHPESCTKSNSIQSFLFPLVYKDYGGDIEQKARVLTVRC